MSKVNPRLFKILRLEDEILEDKTASNRVYKHHWMHEYFQRRYELKVREWERLSKRKYES